MPTRMPKQPKRRAAPERTKRQQSKQRPKEAAAPAAQKTKPPAAPKVKRQRKKKEPPRMCARWGVFDAGMKQVAVFDYNQRAAADRKIAELTAKKNSLYFLQIVKEPMPEPPTPDTPAG